MLSPAKITYSRFLFTAQNDDSPLKFYIPPGSEKQRLKQLIEDGGGIVVNKENQDTIRILTVNCTAKSDGMVSSKYIDDCIEKKKTLNLEDYRLHIGDTIDSCTGSKTKETKTIVTSTTMEVRSKGRSGRSKYLLSEEVNILKYLLEEDRLKHSRGRKVWVEMERFKVTSHSWQSMKDHWKIMMNKLGTFSLSAKDKEKLLKFHHTTEDNKSVYTTLESSSEDSMDDELIQCADKVQNLASTSESDFFIETKKPDERVLRKRKSTDDIETVLGEVNKNKKSGKEVSVSNGKSKTREVKRVETRRSSDAELFELTDSSLNISESSPARGSNKREKILTSVPETSSDEASGVITKVKKPMDKTNSPDKKLLNASNSGKRGTNRGCSISTNKNIGTDSDRVVDSDSSVDGFNADERPLTRQQRIAQQKLKNEKQRLQKSNDEKNCTFVVQHNSRKKGSSGSKENILNDSKTQIENNEVSKRRGMRSSDKEMTDKGAKKMLGAEMATEEEEQLTGKVLIENGEEHSKERSEKGEKQLKEKELSKKNKNVATKDKLTEKIQTRKELVNSKEDKVGNRRSLEKRNKTKSKERCESSHEDLNEKEDPSNADVEKEASVNSKRNLKSPTNVNIESENQARLRSSGGNIDSGDGERQTRSRKGLKNNDRTSALKSGHCENKGVRSKGLGKDARELARKVIPRWIQARLGCGESGDESVTSSRSSSNEPGIKKVSESLPRESNNNTSSKDEEKSNRSEKGHTRITKKSSDVIGVENISTDFSEKEVDTSNSLDELEDAEKRKEGDEDSSMSVVCEPQREEREGNVQPPMSTSRKTKSSRDMVKSLKRHNALKKFVMNNSDSESEFTAASQASCFGSQAAEDDSDSDLETMERIIEQLDIPADVFGQALFMNNGNVDDTVHWILHGKTLSGGMAWDPDDDEIIMDGNEEQYRILEEKYGEDAVRRRQQFLAENQ